MKILLISDVESKSLWDYYEPSKLEGLDLIISCGDLNPKYLSFLATFSHAPILYVHGNHDGCYDETPPEGCTSIDDDIYVFNGVRILGLGGCMKYKKGPYMYSELEMKLRIMKMKLKLLRHRGFDILVTHAPAKDLHDGDDMPHKGYQCFRELLDKYKPALFAYGHVHQCYGHFVREDKYGDTRLVNACEKYVIDIDFNNKK